MCTTSQSSINAVCCGKVSKPTVPGLFRTCWTQVPFDHKGLQNASRTFSHKTAKLVASTGCIIVSSKCGILGIGQEGVKDILGLQVLLWEMSRPVFDNSLSLPATSATRNWKWPMDSRMCTYVASHPRQKLLTTGHSQITSFIKQTMTHFSLLLTQIFKKFSYHVTS